MKVLIVDSGGDCLGREAVDILKLFDPYMMVYRTRLDNAIAADMPEKSLKESLTERWDYLIIIGLEATELPLELIKRSKGAAHIKKEDLLQSQHISPDHASSVYENLKEHLYQLYCDEIRFSSGHSCTCGANVFCKCE